MTKQETKQRILDAGAAIVRAKGFNHTGIAEILAAAQVPKGSFYFYFKNKEAFGLALVEYYGERLGQTLLAPLRNTALSPLERLRAFFRLSREMFAETGYTKGCPLGNLIQEMSGQSELFHQKLTSTVALIVHDLAQVIAEGVEQGDIATDKTPQELARFVLMSWQGSIMGMKLARSDEPLLMVENVLFSSVLRGR